MPRRCTFASIHDHTAPRILLLALLPVGDTLFATPLMRALRARYPGAHMVAAAHAETAPLLGCVPALDGVVMLPHASEWTQPAAWWRALRALRAAQFDVSIDLTSPAYTWISLLCGIRLRTFMKFDPLWWIVPGEHSAWRATHATRHYYDSARELDLPPWQEVRHAPELILPAEACTAALSFLEEAGAGRGLGRRPLVVMHVGGAGMGGLKRWPPGRFAVLADHLHDRWQAHVVLIGGRSDRDLSRAVAAGMRCRPIIAAGALPLLTSMGVIAACDLFVGNDSGPLHAAAAMGTAYVGIFGPTNPANFHPIGVRPRQGTIVQPCAPCRTPQPFVGGAPVWSAHCCRGTCRALGSVSGARVQAAADMLLSRRFSSARMSLGAREEGEERQQ